ncbi:hypothetical protein ABZS79_31965 [Streptomyces griseoloalbus]|uniref:hypothetical protein n=1 Tax=Streptomyces griseoloalbus TaxID=67303 RepID=UPI0033A6465C
MAIVAVVSAVGLAVDDRVLVGAPIWAKPFKFAISFGVYCLSLAWLLSLFPRRRRVAWWSGSLVGLACLAEQGFITLQVIRGTRSHFNNATPFDSAVNKAMAVTVVLLWVSTLVVALLLLRVRIVDRASAWAMRAGITQALLGAAVGFLMVLPTPDQQDDSPVAGAHSVGVPDGGPTMPLSDWSTTGGDLRIPHFFGMHALQLLPLLVMVLAALAPRYARLADERVRTRLVLLASGVYAAVFALLLWQALRGQPLIHPDGMTLAAALAILVVAVLGTYGCLRVPTRSRAEAGDAAVASTAVVGTGVADPAVADAPEELVS